MSVLSAFVYLAGAGRDAGEEAARGHLLVEKSVQHTVGLALGQLALHVVGLGNGLVRSRAYASSSVRRVGGNGTSLVYLARDTCKN